MATSQQRAAAARRGDQGNTTGAGRYQVTGKPMSGADYARAMGGAYGQSANPWDRTSKKWALTPRGRQSYNKYMEQFGPPNPTSEHGGWQQGEDGSWTLAPQPGPRHPDFGKPPPGAVGWQEGEDGIWRPPEAKKEKPGQGNSNLMGAPKEQGKQQGYVPTGNTNASTVSTADPVTNGVAATNAATTAAGYGPKQTPQHTPTVNGYEKFNDRGRPVASQANLIGNHQNTWQQRMAGRGGGAMSSTQGQVAPQRTATAPSMAGPNPTMAQPNAPLGLMVPGSY